MAAYGSSLSPVSESAKFNPIYFIDARTFSGDLVSHIGDG
jgi:hypothetical protein